MVCTAGMPMVLGQAFQLVQMAFGVRGAFPLVLYAYQKGAFAFQGEDIPLFKSFKYRFQFTLRGVLAIKGA